MTAAHKILLPVLLLSALSLSAQKKPVKHKHARGVVEAPPPPEIIMYVEQHPEFPGGEEAMHRFLDANIRYPDAARENDIAGRVLVRFMVNEDGTISHAKVERGIGYRCDEEALRVIRAMPRWHPGKVNGKPVRAMYVLPITFRLI